MERREIAGNLHATGNYSYICTRMGGARWLMVGDAYAFVDPIFSTGVYLAMHSAELAAEVVQASAAQTVARAGTAAGYERNVRKGVASLSWFIFRFNTPGDDVAVPQSAEHPSGGRGHDLHARWRRVPRRRRGVAAAVLQAALRHHLGRCTGATPWPASRSAGEQVAMTFSGGTTRQDAVRDVEWRMSDVATSLRAAPTPRIEYRPLGSGEPLPRDVLGAVVFGDAPPAPRRIRDAFAWGSGRCAARTSWRCGTRAGR